MSVQIKMDIIGISINCLWSLISIHARNISISYVCRWSRGPPRLKLFTFLRSKCQVVLLEVECRVSNVPHPLERGSKLEIRLL